MPEPYHPFIKRAPSGDDSQDNLCAQCGKSPMDGVHNPTPENYSQWLCDRYLIMTTGKGMLPSGKLIGEVDAPSLDIAKQIIAKQVGDWAHKWRYVRKSAPTQDVPAEGKPPQPPQPA